MKYVSREDRSTPFPGEPSFAQLPHFDVLTVPTEDHKSPVDKQTRILPIFDKSRVLKIGLGKCIMEV